MASEYVDAVNEVEELLMAWETLFRMSPVALVPRLALSEAIAHRLIQRSRDAVREKGDDK